MEVQPNLFYFTLDDETSYNHEIVINERPSIPMPEADYYSVGDITGVDGSDYENLGTFRNVEIEFNCSFVSRENWYLLWREIKTWIMGSTHKILRLSDDDTVFRKIAKISINSDSRSLEIGNFTMVVECYPYEYLDDGNFEFKCEHVKRNMYFTSHPIYHIKGSGLCSINVNGNIVQVQSDDEVYIDSDLKIAYDNNHKMVRLKSGNFEDLYLPNGNVSISCDSGFELKVQPNWRSL